MDITFPCMIAVVKINDSSFEQNVPLFLLSTTIHNLIPDRLLSVKKRLTKNVKKFHTQLV